MFDTFLDVALLTFLAAITIAIIRIQSLTAVAMLLSIYSLVSAMFFMLLDAVDVAITEAAVGAGITTVLLLATLAHVDKFEEKPKKVNWLALSMAILTGVGLVYATLDFPRFGDPNAPAHTEVAARYIEKSKKEVGPPNMVTSVLGSYRGYDTLGETTVVFTAAIAVILILNERRRKQTTKGET